MRKKKNYIKLILLLFILLIAYYNLTPINCLKTLSTHTIFIYNQTEGYGVKHTDDKQEILKVLKSMKLKKTKSFNLDNLYYSIYIQRNIRDTINIGIFTDGVVINSIYYSIENASISYEELDLIFNRLDDRYPSINVN